jgi:hypothetical protein
MLTALGQATKTGTTRRLESVVSAVTEWGFRPRKEVMMSGERAESRAELIRVAAGRDY